MAVRKRGHAFQWLGGKTVVAAEHGLAFFVRQHTAHVHGLGNGSAVAMFKTDWETRITLPNDAQTGKWASCGSDRSALTAKGLLIFLGAGC